MTADSEKLREAILYLANHSEVRDLGLTKLYKLLYFADVRRLRDTGGATITGSKYIRYPHGPVPSRAERSIKKLKEARTIESESVDYHGYKLTKISASRAANAQVFSAEELAVLDEVATELGKLSAIELSKLSHAEPAWRYATELGSLDPALMFYGDQEDVEGL